MKKKIIYIAILLICLSLITGGTYAYYTAEATARNVITTGGISVRVVEQEMVNGVLQPYPSQPIKIMPATKVSKIVSVQSEAQAAWIRMNFTLTVYDPQGEVMDIPAEELNSAILIQTDSENWTLKDSWWYYDTAIQGGHVTSPLFREVVFSGTHMDNKYQGCTLEILVNVQGVQQANNGTSVTEALGWPEDET